MPNTSQAIPDLTQRAMLAQLPISRWTAAKHDKQISDEVATAHQADSTMGRYRKSLLPKEALAEIALIKSQAKIEFYKYTLPWNNDGLRILSSTAYFSLAEKMREFKTKYEEAADRFVSQYEVHREEARRRLNGLFDEKDYPKASRIRSKFAFGFSVLPLPSGDDFRVKLGAEETKRVRADIEESVKRSLEAAMSDVWERMREVVQKMVERLRSYNVTEDGVQGAFRDSLVTNIKDLLDLLPSLNVTQNAAIEQFGQRMRDELTRVPPDVLRSDAANREQVAAAAEDILRQMEDFI